MIGDAFMYIKELKYIIIEYSDKDLSYIDNLCEYIDQSCDEIISFLGISVFGEKVKVKLLDNLENFRDIYKNKGYSLDKNGYTPSWVCGFADGNIIDTLCLEEYKKTKSHKYDNLQDLKYLIMHEFTHSCNAKINKTYYSWLGEGLATTITHQMENEDRVFNFTLEEAINVVLIIETIILCSVMCMKHMGEIIY